jgi:prepilin-type N-terminal cleavage/methylation domain-containing protein
MSTRSEQLGAGKGKRGFTLIELLVVMGIIALLLAILLPALGRARANAKQVKDSTQIRGIHQGFVNLSIQDPQGLYPIPGLIDRLPVNGVNVPGKGNEDIAQNNHGALYSVAIMKRAFDTSSLINPAEVSTNVIALANYNYDSYNPLGQNDQYWDPLLVTDLLNVCNTSYGTLVLNGARRAKQWRASYDARFPIIANRGPLCNDNGTINDQAYKASKTLQIHGDDKLWEGNVCFNDNHVLYDNKLQPTGVGQITVSNALVDDNIFSKELGDLGADSFLGVVSVVNSSGTHTVQFD